MLRLNMRDVGKSDILAGALSGKATFARLMALVAGEPANPETLFLDFKEIEVATASFLRESVVSFRDVIRARSSHFYPVVANPNDVVRDEFLDLARTKGDVFLTCRLANNGAPSQPTLLGNLEAKQWLTFDLVRKHGETDAGELMKLHGKQEKVKHTTAWNNRLSSLARLGLIVEVREGRLRRYRPLFKEIS